MRPFLDRPFELRPYLKFCQWQKIWGSSGDFVDPVIPQLRIQAIQEAENLAPVSFNKVHKVVKTLSKKAPGPDGWTNGLLRTSCLLQPSMIYLAFSRLWKQQDLCRSSGAHPRLRFWLRIRTVNGPLPCVTWFINAGSRPGTT